MIYWCDKCKEPVFDQKSHEFSCDGKLKKLSEGSICNPVFLQERKLISKIVGRDLTDKQIWYFGSSRYLFDGEVQRIPYVEWYKNKEHLKYAEELRNDIEVENDYSVYRGVVKANEAYIKGLIFEAEKYVLDTYTEFSTGKYEVSKYIPTISFSGGKDSTVVSKIVRDALQDNTVIHFFGDTTLEFKETYEYVTQKFKQENPMVPMIPSETESDFFKLAKVFGPPSQHERWCCTIFKTSSLNKELENLPGNSLSFLGIRHSESLARKGYKRTQEHSKISSQINAMPIIEWADYDVWLYILYKNLIINDCYQYGYKRVGCWCCPNNSDWSMMLTQIYHPNDMCKWKDVVYDFARKTGKTDLDDYYDEGRWKIRRGASGLKVKNVTIMDTDCNLSDKARNIIIDKKLNKDVLELFKPFGDLKIVEKKDATYIQVYDDDKTGEYRKCFELIITYGTNVIKVLPEERIDATNLIKRIKCQMRKYQFCIRCSACDSVCPHGAIDTIHGKYKIDEEKCQHCKNALPSSIMDVFSATKLQERRKVMIYFDNAATTKYKPEEVYKAFEYYVREVGVSPGRGGYQLGIKASRMLYKTRKKVADYFGMDNSNVIFTKNSTEAINLFFDGYLKQNDHVVITCYEHNAVLRPLHKLHEEGRITYSVITREDLNLSPDEIAKKYTKGNTKLFCITLASNITGRIIYSKYLINHMKNKGITTFVDSSQGAGKIKISMTSDNIDYLAFTGHKDLMALPGVGGLCCKNKPDWEPLIQGGTGILGDSYVNPDVFPEGYEAGTLNMPAIWSLNSAIGYCNDNFTAIQDKEHALMRYLLSELEKLSNVIIYDKNFERVSTICINIAGVPSSEVVEVLDRNGICSRGGIHCAILAHEVLGTVETGVVRISLNYLNSTEEIDTLINVLNDCR